MRHFCANATVDGMAQSKLIATDTVATKTKQKCAVNCFVIVACKCTNFGRTQAEINGSSFLFLTSFVVLIFDAFQLIGFDFSAWHCHFSFLHLCEQWIHFVNGLLRNKCRFFMAELFKQKWTNVKTLICFSHWKGSWSFCSKNASKFIFHAKQKGLKTWFHKWQVVMTFNCALRSECGVDQSSAEKLLCHVFQFCEPILNATWTGTTKLQQPRDHFSRISMKSEKNQHE